MLQLLRELVIRYDDDDIDYNFAFKVDQLIKEATEL